MSSSSCLCRASLAWVARFCAGLLRAWVETSKVVAPLTGIAGFVAGLFVGFKFCDEERGEGLSLLYPLGGPIAGTGAGIAVAPLVPLILPLSVAAFVAHAHRKIRIGLAKRRQQ